MKFNVYAAQYDEDGVLKVRQRISKRDEFDDTYAARRFLKQYIESEDVSDVINSSYYIAENMDGTHYCEVNGKDCVKIQVSI